MQVYFWMNCLLSLIIPRLFSLNYVHPGAKVWLCNPKNVNTNDLSISCNGTVFFLFFKLLTGETSLLRHKHEQSFFRHTSNSSFSDGAFTSVVCVIWLKNQAKTSHIAEFFSRSGLNELMSWWNKLKCSNTSHGTTFTSHIGQMCLATCFLSCSLIGQD